MAYAEAVVVVQTATSAFTGDINLNTVARVRRLGLMPTAVLDCVGGGKVDPETRGMPRQ